MEFRKIKTPFDDDYLQEPLPEPKEIDFSKLKDKFPQAVQSRFHEDIAKLLEQELMSLGKISKPEPPIQIIKSQTPSKPIEELLDSEAGI